MYVIGKTKEKIKFNGFSINEIPIEHTATNYTKSIQHQQQQNGNAVQYNGAYFY